MGLLRQGRIDYSDRSSGQQMFGHRPDVRGSNNLGSMPKHLPRLQGRQQFVTLIDRRGLLACARSRVGLS